MLAKLVNAIHPALFFRGLKGFGLFLAQMFPRHGPAKRETCLCDMQRAASSGEHRGETRDTVADRTVTYHTRISLIVHSIRVVGVLIHYWCAI